MGMTYLAGSRYECGSVLTYLAGSRYECGSVLSVGLWVQSELCQRLVLSEARARECWQALDDELYGEEWTLMAEAVFNKHAEHFRKSNQ